ncbi:hypothetical protein MML48_2g00008645 [Holotrichia oblita]|uniref:Uncharacterized protein n=1 Tax=Holotrichia oblita TaxID=644536 RepID=A0ACB9TIC2_HOLOL|nr:hypothetical protein MML48_2g00008645 [Holotrichia oblita]
MHVKRLQKVGYAPTKLALRRMAFNLAEKMNIPNLKFNKDKRLAGIDWLKAFLARNKSLAVRKAQGVSNARAEGMNKEEVAAYFAILEATLTEHNLFNRPSNIYNVDESELQLNNTPNEVIAEKGSKAVQSRQSSERGETVTVVASCNAEGTFLPPYIIFKGVNKQQAWLDNLPPGASLEMRRESAYINEEIFLKSLKNHFIPRKSASPCLLLLDGHGSHVNSPEILETALQYDVHCLCLPSHTTHFLQLLNRSFFKPLKCYFKHAAIEWGVANPGKKFERRYFGLILQKAWAQAATVSTGSAGFRACGVHPFQPSAIPDYAYLTNLSPQQSSTSELPGTPEKNSAAGVPKMTPSNFLDTDSSTIPKRKQHAEVLTTPENIAARKEKRKNRADRELKGKRKTRAEPFVFRIPTKNTTTFEDQFAKSSGEEWEEDASSEEETITEENFFEPTENVKVGDYVLVEFMGKSKLYYVGNVVECEGDAIKVNFMKKKYRGQFFLSPRQR